MIPIKCKNRKKGKQKTIENRTYGLFTNLKLNCRMTDYYYRKKNRQMKEAFFFQTRANQVEKKIKHNFSFQLARQII